MTLRFLRQIDAYTAMDADTLPNQDVVSYSVGGDDGGNFLISDIGVLHFQGR